MKTFDVVKMIEKGFFEKLQQKNSWGKNEVINLYRECCSDVALLVLDMEEFNGVSDKR